MLMASACSTAPTPRPTVALPANLLTPPPDLPAMPRSPDGQMTAAQALTGMVELYAVAGSIRLQLIGLIEAEKARQAAGKAD